MNDNKECLNSEVIIEIVHSIKEILIALIDRAFPQNTSHQEFNNH